MQEVRIGRGPAQLRCPGESGSSRQGPSAPISDQEAVPHRQRRGRRGGDDLSARLPPRQVLVLSRRRLQRFRPILYGEGARRPQGSQEQVRSMAAGHRPRDPAGGDRAQHRQDRPDHHGRHVHQPRSGIPGMVRQEMLRRSERDRFGYPGGSSGQEPHRIEEMRRDDRRDPSRRVHPGADRARDAPRSDQGGAGGADPRRRHPEGRREGSRHRRGAQMHQGLQGQGPEGLLPHHARSSRIRSGARSRVLPQGVRRSRVPSGHAEVLHPARSGRHGRLRYVGEGRVHALRREHRDPSPRRDEGHRPRIRAHPEDTEGHPCDGDRGGDHQEQHPSGGRFVHEGPRHRLQVHTLPRSGTRRYRSGSGFGGDEGPGLRGQRRYGAFHLPRVRRFDRRIRPSEARFQSHGDDQGAEGVRPSRIHRRGRRRVAASRIREEARGRGRAHRIGERARPHPCDERSRGEGVLPLARILRGPAVHGEGPPIIRRTVRCPIRPCASSCSSRGSRSPPSYPV